MPTVREMTRCTIWLRMAAVAAMLSTTISVPTGFIEEGVVDVDAITGAFAPNPQTGEPMLFLSSKEGLIHVLKDPDNSDEYMLVANFTRLTCTNGERGLQTILPHPNFQQNRYMYVYYTRFTPNCPEDAVLGPWNQLSRFTLNARTLQVDLNSEVVLLETPPSVRSLHNGGSMRIGNDGYLYITTGDGGSREPPYSQNLANLYGKVLRLDLDGNAPPSNPFSRQSNGKGVSCRKTKGRPPPNSPAGATCEEIYAYGLRNPFRMAMDINTKDKVRYVIGDVGASNWEEINEGGDDYSGTNYMWPVFEGPCELIAVSECNRNGANAPGTTLPFYYYYHTQSSRGGAITGSAFVPDGLWPSKYKFLFIDHIFNEVYNLVADSSVACAACNPPRPAFRNETFHKHNVMVDMFFGPYKDTQALFIISRSTGQNVRRIRYTGGSNRAPIAVISVNGTSTLRNRALAFRGSGSSDADGDRLSYIWNFGDGTTSTQTNPIKKYNRLGEFEVTLTVKDTLGQTSQAFVTIIIGTRPTVSMELPSVQNKFSVKEVLRLKGNATDAGGNVIPDDQLFWEVRLHHLEHFHPFLDMQPGNDFDLYPAPEPEELAATTNSYLEVILTAVDSNGVTNTVSRSIRPKVVTINIESDPPGLEIQINEFPYKTPQQITTWQYQVLRLDVKNQTEYDFDSWSVGGSRSRTYAVQPPTTGQNQTIMAIMKKHAEDSPPRTTFLQRILRPFKKLWELLWD